MAFPYYQHAGSGWGTNHYQFGPPPRINFQPQPSWGGLDFFRAHANGSDLSLFNHAFNRIHEYSGGNYGPGVGMNEARHWHRRAYGGLGDMNQLLPDELGHAAAYEAYRTWMHNSSIYEPLGGDMERQRDGLIGLAIAEASKLLQYTGRSMDRYGRMAASEAAAATASYIFSQSHEMEQFGDSSYRRPRSRSRHNSFSAYGHGSMYGGSNYGDELDPYAFDNEFAYPHHHSGRPRRHSSASRLAIGYDGYGANPMPIQQGSSYGSYPTTYGGGYPGSYPVSTSYPVGGGVPYAGSYGSTGGVPVSGGSLIIHSKPRKKHRSSSHHRHGRSRSRSGSVIVPSYAGSFY